MRKTVKYICDYMNDMEFETPNKIFVLENLVNFVSYKNLVLKQNQTMLIEIFTNPSYKNLLILLIERNEIKKLIDFSNKHEELIEYEQILRVPLTIEYFCKQLLLFSALTEDANAITEIRCQTLFDLKFIKKKLLKY